MADLIDLGFELSAQKAESAIDRLMDKFNELEKTKSSVSKFEFTGMENLSQVAKQFNTISSSVAKINKMFGGAAASEAAKQVDSLNIRIGETGKLLQEVGNYRFKTGAELAAQQIKVFETSLNAAAAKLSELSVVQQKISYGGTSSTPAGMSQLAEQLGKLEGQIAPLGGSFKTTFTVITQSIGQAKTQAARFNGEVSKIAVSLNKTGTSIGKITVQMRQLAEAVSRTALRTTASENAMRKMASVNPVNPAAIASVDQLKMKLQEASLAARSFRPIGKIGGSVSVGGMRDMTGGFNQANFAARNLRDTLISMATGGGIAYYFADVTRAAVKFGEELSYIQSLTLDFSKQDMRAGILNMGSMLGDATKNAEAAYYAYSSGVRGGEKGIINFTGNMAKLAKIIRADVIPTVNSVTTIMNAYNLTAADSAELTDLFYGIIKYGKASGPQLASGLGQVAPTAATAELSLNELGASVAALTRVSNTRNAITYFNNMLTKLIKPTKEARLAAANLGIELGLDAVRAKGFTALMQEIREKTQGSQQALTALFPDIRGMRAALQLLNRGWGDFSNMLGIFSNKAGIADEAFQNLEEDLNQQLGALPVTFNKIKIAAGGTITNTLTLGGTLAPLIRDFNTMDESGQKLAGGIALVVGSMVTMKIAGLTLNTVRAMEIRNNEILLAQKKREIALRGAATAAALKEAAVQAATSGVPVTKAGLPAFTKLMAGSGFIGGMGRSGVANLMAAKKMFTYTGAGLSMNAVSASIGKLSGSLLGLIPIITKIGIVSGAVAAVGGLIDIITSPKIDNGLNAAGNSRIVGAIADKLYNFFTGAFDKANEFTERMKMLAESREKDLEVMSVLTKMTDSVMVYAENTPQKTGNIIDQLKKNFENSMAVLKSANYQGMQTELTNLLKQRKELEEKIKKGFNWTETLKLVNEKNKANVKLVNDELTAEKVVYSVEQPGRVRYRSVYDYRPADKAAMKDFEELRKAADNWQSELKKTEERIDALSPMLAKAKEQPLKYGKQVLEILDKQREAVQSINDLIAKQQFDMRSPDKQLNDQIVNADKAYKKFGNILKSGTRDAGLLQGSFKEFLAPANDAIKRLKKNIESFDKMIESTMKSAFDYRIHGAQTDEEKIYLAMDRSFKLIEESGIRMIDGIFSIPKDVNLETSYSKMTSAINLSISAKNIEIERYKRLSEAERHANEKTLDLIRSMDKLGETAVDAVDANSVNAVKLQSRSFMEMPKMNFAQNAENDLGSAQQELRNIYQSAAELADAFMKEAEARKKTDEATQKGLEERILKTFELVQARIKNLDKEYQDQQKDIFSKMQEYEQKSAEALNKLEENSTAAKTSNEKYQQNAENSLREISNNTRVFKDWQKATV